MKNNKSIVLEDSNSSSKPTYYCSMTKKRYAAIISTINNQVSDPQVQANLALEIQRIINFDPDFCTYKKENAEKRRLQRQKKRFEQSMPHDEKTK